MLRRWKGLVDWASPPAPGEVIVGAAGWAIDLKKGFFDDSLGEVTAAPLGTGGAGGGEVTVGTGVSSRCNSWLVVGVLVSGVGWAGASSSEDVSSSSMLSSCSLSWRSRSFAASISAR